MSKLVLLCLVLFTGQQYAAGVLSPSYQYVPEAGTWLRLHAVPATWQDARQRCVLEGGTLASPSSAALTKAMLFMMISHKVHRQVFTGIKQNLNSEHDFMSLDGVPLNKFQLDWAQGEPDNQSDDKICLVLNPTADLADVSCTSAHPYFCRKDNKNNNVTSFNQECGTPATEYQYFARTGSCYKFHRHPVTWDEAAMMCHAEGGYLAIINSDTEAQLITEIFKNNPVHTVTGATHNDVALIGFLKWEEPNDSKWLTIYGQTLKEAGYEKWGKNQPNNYAGVQSRGSIERDGGFNDLTPEDRNPFFCEITP